MSSGASELSLGEQAVRRRNGRQQAAASDDVRRLLDTARELMQAGAAPRVADIVKATGLSNDAFYRYFKTKDDLVAAIVDDGARRLVAVVSARMAQTDDPRAQLRSAVAVVLKQAADPVVALATRNVFSNATRTAGSDRLGRSRLQSGIAALLVPPLRQLAAHDPDRAARAASVLLVGALEEFLWLDPPTAADIRQLTEFILLGCGIGAP